MKIKNTHSQSPKITLSKKIPAFMTEVKGDIKGKSPKDSLKTIYVKNR